jgi:hypothetical protein
VYSGYSVGKFRDAPEFDNLTNNPQYRDLVNKH